MVTFDYITKLIDNTLSDGRYTFGDRLDVLSNLIENTIEQDYQAGTTDIKPIYLLTHLDLV